MHTRPLLIFWYPVGLTTIAIYCSIVDTGSCNARSAIWKQSNFHLWSAPHFYMNWCYIFKDSPSYKQWMRSSKLCYQIPRLKETRQYQTLQSMSVDFQIVFIATDVLSQPCKCKLQDFYLLQFALLMYENEVQCCVLWVYTLR